MNIARQQDILGIILENEPIGITEIARKIQYAISIPTLNRDLASLKKNGFIEVSGKGPTLKYRVHLQGLMLAHIDSELYFSKEPDQRRIIQRFNFDIFDKLKTSPLFTKEEMSFLEQLTNHYQKKISQNTTASYKREFERLMIELSWKSSQIEGNTYDLLDTEQLLKYNLPSPKHTQEETTMLLNHKTAIEYTRKNTDLYIDLSVSQIVDIHSLLTVNMGIQKSVRQRVVRITGSNYLPPDINLDIEQSLQSSCTLINSKSSAFEKAILAILLISYIQPFEDGNKRTARLTANALLMAANCCPLSYRNISPVEYKKAILLFYELNNIQAFKKIFMAQYQFAVENYF